MPIATYRDVRFAYRDPLVTYRGLFSETPPPPPTLEPSDVVSWVDPTGAVTVLTAQPELKHLSGQDGRYMPPLNLVEEEVPFEHGARVRQVRVRSRDTVQPLLVESTAPQSVRNRMRTLARSLDPTRGEGRLRVTGPDGVGRELYCRYADGLGTDEGRGSKGRLWQSNVLTFHANDPFWHDEDYTTLVFDLGGAPQTFFPIFPLRMVASEIVAQPTVTNTGDVEAWPEWTIDGPLQQTILTNLTTGKVINIATPLAGGEVMHIDTRPGRKTVRNAVGNNLYGDLTADSSLWGLVPGTNQIRVEAAGASAASQAVLNYRRRWLSI